MKRVVVTTTILLGLLLAASIGHVFWPYDQLALGLGATDRVESDLLAGYPKARTRADELRTVLRREYPEMRTATFTWKEVRCSIEDHGAQMGIAYAQVCTLRSVWLVPVRPSRWDDCSVVHRVVDDVDATATMVRARAKVMVEGTLGAIPCPEVGPASRVEPSTWQTPDDRSELVSGRRPVSLRGSPSWKVFEVEVPLSETMIGCRPAFPFCRSRFDEPSMGGVAAFATPS